MPKPAGRGITGLDESRPFPLIPVYYPKIMDAAVPPEVVLKALRKTVAAIEGVGHKAVAIGAIAHQAWGAKREPQAVDLLISTGEAQRESILGAARGEGLQQPPGGAPLTLRYTDAKLGASADVTLVEAATPFLKQVIGRAQRGPVLQIEMPVATCDDLILLRAGSALPADRDIVVELLRGNAGRIDPAYLKREAEAAGVFDKLKSAWQQAKQQG